MSEKACSSAAFQGQLWSRASSLLVCADSISLLCRCRCWFQCIIQHQSSLTTVESAYAQSLQNAASAARPLSTSVAQQQAASGARPRPEQTGLQVEKDEFDQITDKHIPQRPVTVVEGASYTVVIIGGAPKKTESNLNRTCEPT